MSYPVYDFRYKLDNPKSEDDLIKSLILEPWSELISSWVHLKKPEHLISIFEKAIEYNVATSRYSPLILSNSTLGVQKYPEFKNVILKGLYIAWTRYSVRYENDGLFIGTLPGNVNLPSDVQIHLIDHIRTNGKCTIQLEGHQIEVGIWMERSVQYAYHLINLLSISC